MTDIGEHSTERRIVRLQEASFGAAEIGEALDSLHSTRVVMGEKCWQFESDWSAWQRSRFSVFVNSGSSANLLIISLLKSLRASYRLVDGDEILLPAVTWSTTLFPIIQLGLKPVLVDVKANTFNIDVEACERAVTSRTRAIFIVHLLGNPCNLDELLEFTRSRNLILIEDCCEAHGAEWNGKKVGNFGVAGSFSFMFAHHMTTIEGGMLCCADPLDARVLKAQRAHGWIREFSDEEKEEVLKEYQPDDDRFLFWDLGFNVRPTEINAAFGLHQLRRLDEFIRVRQRNFDSYMAALEPVRDRIRVQGLESKTSSRRSNFAFGFYIDDARFARRDLMEFLAESGVESRPLVAGNLRRHPFFAPYLGALDDLPLPVGDAIHAGGIYLPNHQGLDDDDIEFVASRVIEFFER